MEIKRGGIERYGTKGQDRKVLLFSNRFGTGSGSAGTILGFVHVHFMRCVTGTFKDTVFIGNYAMNHRL